ncbi:MAG: signal recognition particle-docking protein FtsY [Candidatus Lokiarchaeota archaeon]|nr:signal recognition particle-docking protein FtsY [Candidatus Lokiarchaeota archaeon]
MFSKLKGAFSKLGKRTLNEKNMENTLEDLKIALIKNDVAYDAAETIVEKTKKNMIGEQVGMFSLKKTLTEALKEAIYDILSIDQQFSLIEEIKKKKQSKEPYIILVLGVNGTGKTTTIAKLCTYFKKHKITSVVAASDTFRAGAIEQLHKHLKNVEVRIIKGKYNADPASVAFDAINHAVAKYINVVIIDTAGRQVTNKNLMEELKKIKRVNEPDLTLFIGDSLAGNDVLVQAEEFDKAVGIDASIITKLDADSKGGAALSIAHITNEPILFVGVGQGYEDLEAFDPQWFLKKLLG